MASRAKQLLALLVLAIGLAATPAPARANEATGALGVGADESARLARGETLTREQTIEQGGTRYVGGVTYTLLDATADEMDSVFDDVNAYKRVLPRTKDAKLIGRNGPDTWVELHQGNSLVEAAYTIRIRKGEAQAGGAREVRFWLDPTKPHAIADAWGFFRVAPVTDPISGAPKVLLTYGILVDLGPGLVRELFEERVRVAMLSVPQLVRGYVAENVRQNARL